MSYRHLVSLGSSFAAGPGIPPAADAGAMRSARNYPHLLADRLGARLTDLTVSGATTETVLARPQRTLRGKVYPPQIEGVPEDADLATVTIGGNDLKYVGGLSLVSMVGLLRVLPFGGLGARVLSAPLMPHPESADFERVTAAMVTIVEETRARAPRARVVLVDYFTVIGPEARPSLQLSLRPEDVEHFRKIGEGLDAAYEVAARESGADLVKVSQLSRSHGLGSASPWIIGLRPSPAAVPFHPTVAGMQAVADAIAEAVSPAQ